MLTITDLFCGGGGSSTGAIQVPGVEIRIAANHWDLAVEVHNRNHPTADHAAVDLHEEDPRYFPKTDVLWASPECTKWSQASGGKYASVSVEANLLDLLDPELVDEDPETAIVQRSRLLMFDVLRFAEHHRYKAMVIENVVDIATNPKFREAWALWRKSLTNLGYEHRVVSLNSMHAQAHGDPAPQSRDRLYVVCWLKGNRAPDVDKVMRPLAWCPTCSEVVESQQVWKNGRTVGKYRSQYVYLHGACGTAVEPGFLPAAAAIDWTLRGKRIGDRAKPLADKTRRRIAAGIARYWAPFHLEAGGNQYDASDPKHRSYGDPNAYYRACPVEEYLRVLHTAETKALAIPVEGRDGKEARPLGLPGRTQTTRNETGLLTPISPLPGLSSEERRELADLRQRLDPRNPFLNAADRPGLAARLADLEQAVAARTGHPLPALHVSLMGGTDTHVANSARPVDRELRTLTAEGNNDYLLTPYYGSAESSKPVDQPIGTLTTRDRYALIMRNNSGGAEMTTPVHEVLRTLTTAGHQSILTPGDLKAAEAQVDDCLFRMLEPHEVAAGMAFPADYIWGGTRRERVKLCGNAVTPPAARDLIAAVAESLGGAA
jgi:DNA (cytosine-5)-methyltransferase 1